MISRPQPPHEVAISWPGFVGRLRGGGQQRDAAQQAAQALRAAQARRALVATAVVGGRADIRLGHAVALEGLERADVNALYEVRAVQHVLGRGGGFTTTLNLARHPS